MFWADKIAKEIIDSGKYTPYWVDDMKTPSGRIHVGSLRGVIIHDLVHKAILSAGKKSTFTYVFDDHDPMDALPVYLDEKEWGKHLGKPLFTVPSPDKKAENYAVYFAQEFTEVFNAAGCMPKLLRSSDLYKSGKMNEYIKLCLDNATTIRGIYETMYKKKMASDWVPYQIVCPKCGKESTTRITQWDGKEVTFTCKVDAVDWTNGCGYEGKTSPFSDEKRFAGKLSWKVEWPVKWKVIGVTVEGAGKDHMSAGGSHDVAKQVCEKVLKYPVPYPVAYEFFLIGGKKMSSSKGVGSSAKEVSEILPPYLLRFLFTRTDYNQAINFDPVGTWVIPDLFDEYDRSWQAYITGSDPDLARIFELSQVARNGDRNPVFLPRFRDVANYIQLPNVDITQKFEEVKGKPLTTEEKSVLDERIDYAKRWLERFAPDDAKMQMMDTVPEQVASLSDSQRAFLSEAAKLVEKSESADELQTALYEKAKQSGISVKDAFAAIYTAFLGKTHGPRAGWFLLQYPKPTVKQRLEEAVRGPKNSTVETSTFSRPDLFSIDPAVLEKFPSVSIGIAIIKGVTITKTSKSLQEEIDAFLSSVAGLTTDTLGKYPEIQSYRQIYKATGVDWHSRRPSPEALLRRVALGKGLYSINTCVDAYNLVVMKQRISSGAFDLDAIRFPTVLRFARAGETIHLLGDEKPTPYKEGEIAYFDQEGGFNIDFNYRDAQRTKVSEKTKNIWINIDGVFSITPKQVEKTLHDTITIIQKYCGGTVELQGVITS